MASETQHRFAALIAQAELGERLKRECRRKGVKITAVERAMGLGPSVLSHYLRGGRPWVAGLEDFEQRVRAGIERAIAERESAA